MLSMFYYTFYRMQPSKLGFSNIEEGIQAILSYPEFRDEIVDILNTTRLILTLWIKIMHFHSLVHWISTVPTVWIKF